MTLILELPAQGTDRLRERAEREGKSQEALAAELILAGLEPESNETEPEERPDGMGNRRLSDIFEEIRRQDATAWSTLPADISEEHDHYAYGSPKR